MKRAFCYLRVSTDRQEVEAQRSQSVAFAAYRGYELLDLPDEIDVSGSVPFAQRPVGAEILRRLAEVDAIIFPKVDRGFRDTVDAILTVADLGAAGKDIHFLDIGIDTTTPAGKLCFTVMAAMAEFERGRIGERIREKMAEKAKDKSWRVGPAPFGSRNLARMVDGKKVDGGRHERRDDEAAVIERIVELDAKGLSLRAIAGILNFNGVPTRKGKAWGPQTIANVIGRAAV
jgi:DNA invertase Pin-like site-specific DNA recombinase